MGRKYANPPLIEAACELKLPPDSKWDLTIPGMIYEKVKNDFPNRETRLAQEIEFVQTPQGMGQRLNVDQRAFFISQDGKVLSPNRVSSFGRRVALKPYPTWNGFKPKIEEVYAALGDIVKPKGLQRIGLRYINRIEVPSKSFRLDKYFEFRPFWGIWTSKEALKFLAWM